MNPVFFQQVESILSPERLDAYRQDGAAPAITLARYLWNMALCEALYSPLQIAEIALRNALHGCLSTRFGGAGWYDVIASLAHAIDRFTAIHQAGLTPWLDRQERHWPNPSDLTGKPTPNSGITIVSDAFDAANGAETPFGHRWGGDVFRLATEHFVALQTGQTLALDVQSEYIAFLKCAASAKQEKAILKSVKGLAYGG
jgi:hypothetical protein